MTATGFLILGLSAAWLVLSPAAGDDAAGDAAKRSTAASVQAPAEGSVEYEGHAYLLVDDVEELSWPGAQRTCTEMGGHLVVVTSRGESDFIRDLCDGRYMFLGASDAGEEGQWAWVDGSPWSFTNWLDGQPNDYTGSEDYLATYDGGEWVDVDASGDDFWMPTGYICEWDLPAR